MQKEINNARLERLMSGDYEFKVTDYISRGFKLLQENIGGFIGFTLLCFVVQAIVGQIEESLTGGSLNILSYVINAMWLPGFYIVASKIHKREAYTFNNFFDGHKQGGRLIGVYFLIMLIAIIPMIPAVASLFFIDQIISEVAFMMEAAQAGELYIPQFSLLSILLMLAGFLAIIYLQVSYIFAVPLVTFTNLGVWEAMEMSRKVAAKNFLPILGFLLLVFLINIGGVIMLLIGALFTYPAMMCAIYLAFEDVFRLEAEEDNDFTNYSEHFVE